MHEGESEVSLPEEDVVQPEMRDFNAPMFHPVVGLTTLQRRGSLTVPASLRQAIGLTDNTKCLIASQADGTVTLRLMPPPTVWFARHDAHVITSASIEPQEAVPKRWLDTATILRAQAYPDGAQRRWFVDGDQGFVTARVDPGVRVVTERKLH